MRTETFPPLARPPVPGRSVDRGFTLVEVMVVVAILAILLAAAGPSFREFMSGQQVKAVAYDVTADLLLARSEALKRGASITITPTDGTNWSNGWCAYQASGTCSDATARVSQHPAIDSTVQFVSANAISSVTFDVNGRVSSPSTAVRLTLKSSVSDNITQRCVQLDLSGRARGLLGACS